MEHLASVAELAYEDRNDSELVKKEPQQQQQQPPKSPSPPLSSPSKLNKRPSMSTDSYLSPDEHLDVHNLLAAHDSYIFPRDDQLNYICVFQGCTKPILRGMDTQEYFAHLQYHASQADHLLANMLRRVPSEEDKRKRRRANSTNTYNMAPVPVSLIKKRKESVDSAFEREDMSPPSSPTDSPPPIHRKRAYSTDEYNIPLKPSSRGVQLRDQMLRYGLHLFRIDSEGKYICFFDECSLHMMTNFSRHIAKHEKNGDKIKQELLHLCSPAVVQQQLQQHPSLHLSGPIHQSSLSPSPPPGPLQQLLYRQQQESIQLQQTQQSTLLQQSGCTPQQLEQIQNVHQMQFQQLQMQHKQQLQILNNNLHGSPPHSPHQQISQQTPNHHYPHQRSNSTDLGMLGQVQNEADLALMRSQISKMLEESSRTKQRSRSVSYSPSPSSPLHFQHPPASPPHHSQAPQLVVTPPHHQNYLYGAHPSELPPQPQKRHLQVPSPVNDISSSPPKPTPYPAARSSSPSPPPNEIQWIFPKSKPVLSK